MTNEALKECLKRFKTGIFSEEDRQIISDVCQSVLDGEYVRNPAKKGGRGWTIK